MRRVDDDQLSPSYERWKGAMRVEYSLAQVRTQRTDPSNQRCRLPLPPPCNPHSIPPQVYRLNTLISIHRKIK